MVLDLRSYIISFCQRVSSPELLGFALVQPGFFPSTLDRGLQSGFLCALFQTLRSIIAPSWARGRLDFVFLLCFPFGRKQEHIKSCSGQILLSYEIIYWCYVANRKPILNLEIGTEIFNRSGENRELNYESQSHFLLTLTYSGLPIFNVVATSRL